MVKLAAAIIYNNIFEILVLHIILSNMKYYFWFTNRKNKTKGEHDQSQFIFSSLFIYSSRIFLDDTFKSLGRAFSV